MHPKKSPRRQSSRSRHNRYFSGSFAKRSATTQRRPVTFSDRFAVLAIILVIGGLALVLFVLSAGRPGSSTTMASGATQSRFLGTTASPQVHTVITLGSTNLHPRQLAYDSRRNGLWFWTSVQNKGVSFTNVIYFYDIAHKQLHSWPLYSGDWSAQLLSGIAVAPSGDVWVGWNLNLIDFHPTTGTYTRYSLPKNPEYPLPSAALRDLPANLGVSDIAVAQNGVVWIARYGALSLTLFTPATSTFSEVPLPMSTGDPAKLVISPQGEIFFTTNLSASHIGYSEETVGEYYPSTRQTHVFQQSAASLAVTPQGDVYTAISGGDVSDIGRLTAGQIASVDQPQAKVTFQQNVFPLLVDGTSLAADNQGRIWVSVGGKPQIAAVDTASGTVQVFQYSAPSIAANPPTNRLAGQPTSVPAGAVYLRHIVAMVTDNQGHLWYIFDGTDTIQEVAA